MPKQYSSNTQIFSVKHISRMLRYTNQIFSSVFGDSKMHTIQKKSEKHNTQQIAKETFYSMRAGDDLLGNSNFSPLSMSVNDHKSSVRTDPGGSQITFIKEINL